MEVDCGADVEITGIEHLQVFESSEWAERGFCGQCGTHLFYRLTGTGGHMVPVGVLDDDSARVFATQVFIDAKPNYYAFANETENLTGEELFAKYAPPSD